MTTREKILVGVMCLSIVYGAYELTGGRRPKPPAPAADQNATEELRTFVADISQKLADGKVTEEQRHLMRQAAAGWMKDPFIVSTRALKAKGASDVADAPSVRAAQQQRRELVYTGFLDMDGSRIAIINGTEYTTGESLDIIKGHYVKSISPGHVVLGQYQSADTIKLPLHDVESGPKE